MDVSQDDLNSEQTEKLLQFQDLTGIDQMQRCRRILEGHDWNIEAAVQDTFNEQEGAPTVFHQAPPQPEERAPLVNLQPSNQRHDASLKRKKSIAFHVSSCNLEHY
ncbi:FAS-associated factor 2 [Bulinus truncatus]|nr:FAS-associated factor 2 [Bulinus truncatus]